MAWKAITETDIRHTLSSVELNAFTQAATEGVDQDDMIAAVARKVAAFVRGYVGATGCRLSPDPEELPEGVLAPALDLCVYEILKSLPIDISAARSDARKDALAFLEKVAAKKIAVQAYGAEEGDVSGGVGVSVVRKSDLRVTPENLTGL